MLKLFYFVNRKPSFTAEGFKARWRQHGALAASRRVWETNMLVYIQADTLRPSPIPGTSTDYDGIAQCLPNHPDRMRAADEADQAITRQLPPDELETFAGPIPPRLISADQDILRAGGTGIAAYLAFTDIASAEALAAFHLARPGLERIVLNRVGREIPVERPFDAFAAIVELCAVDEAALIAAFDVDDAGLWRTAVVTLVVWENLLWDRREAEQNRAPGLEVGRSMTID